MASNFNGNGNGNGYHRFNGNGNGNGQPSTQTEPSDLPPHNLEAERGVLGSMLLDNNQISLVLEVLSDPGEFFRHAHSLIFAAILELHSQNKPADGITLANHLELKGEFEAAGGDEYVQEIIEGTPHAGNAVYYAQIVQGKATARHLSESAQEMLRRIQSNTHTPEELVSYATSRFDRLADLEDEDEAFDFAEWPDEPDPIVYHGLAGQIIGMLAPHTEAGLMAIHAQVIAGFGNMIGPMPYWQVEATKHRGTLNVCIVGDTAKSRKGTSWDIARFLLEQCDPVWAKDCITNGLSSGEGMIEKVRDPTVKRERTSDGRYEEREIEPGSDEKRVLWVETEFGRVLKTQGRDGNILNSVIRQAWDGHPLSLATKNNPRRATGHHISIITHITQEEVNAELKTLDMANGFANRFLMICSRRSKLLPDGGRIREVDFRDVIEAIRRARDFALFEFADGEPIERDRDAQALWRSEYPALSAGVPGLLGAITSRSEAYVMRLAMLYALLDRDKFIREEHLRAGLAFWKYCAQSAEFIFGSALGDPVSKKILKALRAAGEAGLTTNYIGQKVLSANVSAKVYMAKLEALMKNNQVYRQKPPGRRQKTTWRAR
jgi:hypothetical protein